MKYYLTIYRSQNNQQGIYSNLIDLWNDLNYWSSGDSFGKYQGYKIKKIG